MPRPKTKWATIFLWLILTLTASTSNLSAKSTKPVVTTRVSLKNVDSWGYQLQNVKPRVFAKDGFDVLVVDYLLNGAETRAMTKADVAALRSRTGEPDRLILAYLSIGEAEDYRFYWKNDWTTKPPLPPQQANLPHGFMGPSDGVRVGVAVPGAVMATLRPEAPAWLADENPEWRGNYLVRYWDPQWQAIIFGSPDAYLDKIIEAGFDGIYIDKVDSNDDWQKSRPSAAREMVDFVKKIATYARSKRTDFLIVPQNGEELLEFKDYVKTIDAIAKESLLFGAGQLVDNARNKPADVRKTKRHLDKALQAKRPVFVVEYIDQFELMGEARKRLLSFKYIPTFARRALDEHPIVLPPSASARE